MAIFQVDLGQLIPECLHTMSQYWILLELRVIGGGGNNWSYKTCKAPVIVSLTSNKPTSRFLTGQMPFLSPNQQCQSTEGKSAAQTRNADYGLIRLAFNISA